MATYRNKNDDTIIRGSEFKVNISIDSKGEYHMSDVVFACTFMCGGKSKTLAKYKVTKQMFSNAGTGSFTLGPDVT